MTEATAAAPGESYTAAGPPGAAPIVFVHGTRLTRTAWTAQLGALTDAYRVIAMDLPGHGSLAGRPFTIAAAADELARVIEIAAGGRAVVVGLSLGGYVAMDLAARRPELIRGLVLSGATQEPVGIRARPYLALAWAIDRLGHRGMDRLNRWFFRTRFPPGHRRSDHRIRVPFRRRLGGPSRARRGAVRPATRGLPRPGPHHQRRARRPVPTGREAVRRGGPRRPSHPYPGGDPPRQSRPAEGVHGSRPQVRGGPRRAAVKGPGARLARPTRLPS